jgi:phosphoenolpyruvate carboxylase
MASKLSPQFKQLVFEVVHELGRQIRGVYGEDVYQEIEKIRRSMTSIRGKKVSSSIPKLVELKTQLSQGSTRLQKQVAKSFALMMELINTGENAYRCFRLKQKVFLDPADGPEIVFVFTSHPTEARSVATIPIFKEILRILVKRLEAGKVVEEAKLAELIRVLLRVPLAPMERPTPLDEIEYTFSFVLDANLLDAILSRPQLVKRLRYRAWVGGDKDGHPGVDENTTAASLQHSRGLICDYIESKLHEVKQLLKGSRHFDPAIMVEFEAKLEGLRTIQARDDLTLEDYRTQLFGYFAGVESHLGFRLDALEKIERLTSFLPQWVVPVELRESAEILEQIHPKNLRDFAIVRMLEKVQEYSGPSKIRGYAQAWILSQCSSAKDLENACAIQKQLWKAILLPVVPLFESAQALEEAPAIVTNFLENNPEYKARIAESWRNLFELMLGYSDSAKEMGSLASRVAIAKCMHKLEAVLSAAGVQPIFFHGTGGSVARGGGPIEEQISWWSPAARRICKLTIQGEMVARSLASPEHLLNQLGRIHRACLQAPKLSKALRESPVLENFAKLTAQFYEARVNDEHFLALVNKATLYPFLDTLKIGSRPAKRYAEVSKITSLRAIPWILCWNQSRIILPGWICFTEAWSSLSAKQKKDFLREARSNPLLITQLKLMAFTLSKIDFAPWLIQVAQLQDPPLQAKADELYKEYLECSKLVLKLMGKRELLWFRPWLKESIRLRGTMIHPLSILQALALSRGEEALLRLTVTGISSGMLTTG